MVLHYSRRTVNKTGWKDFKSQRSQSSGSKQCFLGMFNSQRVDWGRKGSVTIEQRKKIFNNWILKQCQTFSKCNCENVTGHHNGPPKNHIYVPGSECMTVILFSKSVFADASKDLKMRLPWMIWVRPQSSDECPSEKQERRDRGAHRAWDQWCWWRTSGAMGNWGRQRTIFT